MIVPVQRYLSRRGAFMRVVPLCLTALLAASISTSVLAQESAPASDPMETVQPSDPAVPLQAGAPDAEGNAQSTDAQSSSPEIEDADAEDGVEPVAVGDEAPDTALPHDLSPWGMFMAADWVVKSVMIGLAFASLVTWTVWLAKSLELAGARRRLRVALQAILGSRTLAEASRKLADRKGMGVLLVRAAEEEVKLSAPAINHVDHDGLKERIVSRLSRIQAQGGRRLSRGTGVLATIGSTAPFVGLFGTVWGIMNSFIGISEAQTTNLAVVAPGIAEALLATAIGLVAAIPAVVIYNVFARAVTGYRQGLADAAAGVERLVSRDLDYRHIPVPPQMRKPVATQAAE